MLIPQKKKSLTRESRLSDIENTAAQLPQQALESLHEFSAFLAQKYPPELPVIIEIVPIPRPDKEGVIPAIKRLAKTYPMLDKKILFEQTSAAMSAHVLSEVNAEESIDRLESVFRKEYEEYLERLTRK